MSDTTRTTPWPIRQSYIERLPAELLENIFESFRAKPASNYLARTNLQDIDGYHYETCPVDTVSYRQGRRALHTLSLVSKKLWEVAHRMLFAEIWIADLDTLFGLVKSLALYPDNRPHVKRLGVDKVFFGNCYDEDCDCAGQGMGCTERSRHHVDWKTDKDLEETCWGVFNEVLKVPMMRTFPDVRQILEMQQELEVRLSDRWHWMTDAAFERVCNLALKLIIFFSPRLRSLRLTSTTWASPYIFCYALGIIPLQITHLDAFSIHHSNNCAKFLTVLSIDLSSLRVCYGRNLLHSRASRCLESIEELTVVDDGQVELGPGDESRCRGIEPDFLQLWLEPTKRLRKFRLYTGFDLEGLAGRRGDPLGYNINTILLCHQNTLRHFEWCQMVTTRTTSETAWKKMFGEEQKLACLPHLKELAYLKLSHMFVYTRQQYIDRILAPVRPLQPPILAPVLGMPAPIPTNTPPVPDAVMDPRLLEINIRSILTHNLSELGAPPKLRSIDVVGNLPTDRCITIEL